MQKVYIVVLNYNNWADTIECAESLLRSDYHDYKLVIVDNCSGDNSIKFLKEWACGNLCALPSKDIKLRNMVVPPCQKPFEFVEYNEKTLEDLSVSSKECLVLIRADSNKGYAAGNNIGIKYALTDKDAKYIWVLNNDTVVPSDALSALIQTAQAYEKDHVGIIGATLMEYNQPEKVQSLGGVYNKLIGSVRHLKTDEARSRCKIDYYSGASLFVTTRFLRDVGLISEKYFLYFEEMDWFLRSKLKGRSNVRSDKCLVYHKEGRSTGSANNSFKRSQLSDYYWVRNRIIFTRRFFPLALPLVYLASLGIIFNRILRRHFNRVPTILKALKDA